MIIHKKIKNYFKPSLLYPFTLVVFGLQATYLAVTSRFTMPFDEVYHLNLIQFFGSRLNPIISSQSPDSYQLGAVVQNPSFLFHYLLSFPYRFIGIFTDSIVTKIIILRLINVAIMLIALILIKKSLRLLIANNNVSNLALFIFAFTPITVVLASQISYDNLTILLTVLSIYLTTIIIKDIDKNKLFAKRLALLTITCLVGGLVKFTFMPIFLAIGLLLGWKYVRQTRAKRKMLLADLAGSFKKLNRLTSVPLIAILILLSGLFVKFYGVNAVVYHNPAPQCGQVLGVEACKHYYAWVNNYDLRQQALHNPIPRVNILVFGEFWLIANTNFLFGAVMPLKGVYYQSPILFFIIILFCILGLISVIAKGNTIYKRHKYLVYILFICLIYCSFVFGRNYNDYLHLGVPQAINGRYLLPVLMFPYALLVLGVHYLLCDIRGWLRGATKSVLVLSVLTSFLIFGGFVQYVSIITPKYGRLNSTNTVSLQDYQKNWPELVPK